MRPPQVPVSQNPGSYSYVIQELSSDYLHLFNKIVVPVKSKYIVIQNQICYPKPTHERSIHEKVKSIQSYGPQDHLTGENLPD